MPTDAEIREATTQEALYGAQGAGLRLAAQVLPPVVAGADTSDWKNYVPGILPTAYGYATGLANFGVNALDKFAQATNPVTADIPSQLAGKPFEVPGTETANAMRQASIDAAFKLIPHAEATTPAAQRGQQVGMDIAEGASTLAPPGLGIASKIAGYVLPALKAAPVAGAIGGIIGALTPTDAEAKAKQPLVTPIDQTPPPPAQATGGKQATPLVTPITDMPLVTPITDVPSGPPASTQPLDPNNDTGISYAKWGGYGLLALAGAWAAARYGPRGLNTVSDFIHGVSRDPAEVTAALNAPGYGLRGTPAVEMPLPNDAGGFTRRWTMQNQNPNAVLNSLAQAPEIAPLPGQTDALQAANYMINDPGNANRRLESLYRTGVDASTGRTFPVMINYKAAVEALTPDEQNLFHNASWGNSELNIRNQKITEAAKNGVAWTPATDDRFRVSLMDIPTEDLRAQKLAAEANPRIAALLDQNKAIQTSVVDDWRARDLISQSQADYAKKWYPDFMPTIDADGNYLHSWDAKMRDVNSGYRMPPANAWDAMDKHFGTMMQQGELKQWQRDWLLHIEAQQAANPSIGEIVTRRLTPVDDAGNVKSAEGSLDRHITVQTVTGPATFDINNSALWRSLGGGKQQTILSSGIGNAIRVTAQNASTGLLSTAFGSPFALKTFIRDLALIPAQTPSGAWRGYLDKATGVRLPYDPTFIAGSLKTAGQDVGAVVAKNAGDILGNRYNPLSAGLRKYWGDTQVDAWSHWMAQRYEASKLAYRESQGVGAGGNRQMLNMNVLASDASAPFRDPTGASVSPLLSRQWAQNLPSSVPMPNAVRGAVESYFNLNSMAREIYGAIADAPHSFTHDLNMANPRYTPQTLAAMVQNVTGNPGTRGMGRMAQRLSQNLPFYNTTIQAMAGTGRAIRDNPIQTGATVATTLALAAVGEHLSALLSGPEHVKFLEDKLSNDTQSRNATFFHGPGTDPTNHTELPLANEYQGLWPYFSGVAGHAIGTWNAHANEDTLERLTHTLAGVFGAHVSVDTARQTGAGLVSGFMPVDVPAALSTGVAALTGQQVQNVPGKIVSNLITGRPWSAGMTRGGGPQRNVPGQGAPDSALIGSDSGTLHAVMSSLGGAFGTAWDLAHNFSQRSRLGSDWAWQGLWNDYKQQWQDNTRYANTVWQNNLPQSTFGPLEERTAGMWGPVSKSVNAVSDIRGEGFSKTTRGVPLVVTSDSPVPPESNPVMRNLYLTMAEGGKAINRNIMPREQEIRAQIANLKDAPFQPDEKRRLGNQYSDQLYNIIAEKHRALLDLNARLSALAGGRHVDVGSNIDWKGDITQFHQ